jgi:hypothetical protein
MIGNDEGENVRVGQSLGLPGCLAMWGTELSLVIRGKAILCSDE